MNWSTEPLGLGAVLLLTLLLALSTGIALFHTKRLKTEKNFLFVDHQASGIDFIASQVGYYMSLAAGVILIPTLAYQFGPLALVFVSLYFVSAVVTYSVLLRTNALQNYLQNDYGLPRFISGNVPVGAGKRVIEGAVALVMVVVYWGLFAIEIVVLKKIVSLVFPGIATSGIVVVASLLVIMYASLGGYLSTMRTDGLQTAFLIIAIMIFTCIAIPKEILRIPITSRLFEVRLNVPLDDVIGLGISAVLLGSGYLLAGQDAWSRVSAVSKRVDVKKIPFYLYICLLAIIPSIAIGLWGLYIYEFGPSLSNQADIEAIPALIILKFVGTAPIGLLIPAFVAVAISTADTALLTCTQAIATFRESWVDNLRKCRSWTAIIGVCGLAGAFLSPSAVDAIFGLGAIPLAFISVILGRIWTKKQAAWPALVVIMWGVVMGFVIIFVGGEFRNEGPVILVAVSLIAYPILEFVDRKLLA